jgi:hypothetical protein
MLEDLARFMVYDIDKKRELGANVREAVKEHLLIWELGRRECNRMEGSHGLGDKLPSLPTAVRFYFRAKRKQKTGFPRDDVLRARIHDLKPMMAKNF